MTQYFDTHGEEITRMRKHAAEDALGWARHGNQLDEIDRVIVWDVSLCTEFEGFPDDLRQKVRILATIPESNTSTGSSTWSATSTRSFTSCVSGNSKDSATIPGPLSGSCTHEPKRNGRGW